ncbi:MAG: molecular chaperone HtpG [Gammaproteobacteria bacterium]|nr:molecular chaperone HtpG [Gammaproteobacteria bacterium]
MAESQAKETHDFQTEVRQLLDLMIHSLYSNKEIFLRELISNASDAADKLRFEALSNDALYEGEGELNIRVGYDKDARTISVRDNGIGMSYQEAIEHLGTIAKSGTRQFFEALTGDQAKDAQLIGQFGVGFYSSFIVADRVTVTSRRAGLAAEDGVRWESDGKGEFSVEHVEVPKRGTEVVLRLREDMDEFLDGFKLRSIIKRFSDHISLPILMDKEGDEEGEEPVNSATALWTRAKHEIKENEYHEFYKHVAHDFEDPLAYVHSKVEGKLEYTSLLFIPSRAPFDLWDRNVRRGVHLYVRRIFIMDDAEQLMPAYLRFVRGVIDSADLPLNISREILQQNRQIDSIRSGSVKKVLDLLANIAENDKDKYAKFWSEFGKVLKEGVVEDAKNRESIARLLRFSSTRTEPGAQTVSLDEYISRMPEGQKKIYYITADNDATARNSPHLEVFKAHDVEVLLLTDEIDEWLVHHLHEYEGKALQSVTKGEIDLEGVASKEEKKKDGESGKDHAGVVERFKEALGDRVKDVRVTTRLTASPACLVADEHEMGAHLERILKAAGQDVPRSRPILEINPEHFMVRHVSEESDAGKRGEWAGIIFDQAHLSEGGQLDDPAGFVRRLNELVFSEMVGETPAAAGKAARAKRKKTTAKKAARKKPGSAGKAAKK